MPSNALQALLLCLPICAYAQGTFVYDQQSVTNDAVSGEGAPGIQPAQPMGQSFTPALDSIGFIRLWTGDSAFNGLGAILYVNLRSDSITGQILSSTSPVFLPDGFVGHTTFGFPSAGPVTPGTTYFFQPVVQTGDIWQIIADPNFNYPGGTAFAQGLPAPPFDLWFREGIIVPEPSSLAMALSGFACFAVLIRRRRNR